MIPMKYPDALILRRCTECWRPRGRPPISKPLSPLSPRKANQPPHTKAGRLAREEGNWFPADLDRDGQDLTAAIVAAGLAGGMRHLGATTLGALAKLWGNPAVGGFADAQAHLGSFTFWDTHGR